MIRSQESDGTTIFSGARLRSEAWTTVSNVIHAAYALGSIFWFMVQGSDEGQVKLNLWIDLQHFKHKPKTIYNSSDLRNLKM